MNFKIDNSISWSDVFVVVIACTSFLGGFYALSGRVEVLDQKAEYNTKSVDKLESDLDKHIIEARAERQQVRIETRDSLQVINQKLDRLIERLSK